MVHGGNPSNDLNLVRRGSGDEALAKEKIRSAARTAPFWTMALMIHVIVAAVMGLVVVGAGRTPRETASVTMSFGDAAEALTVEDVAPSEPPPQVEVAAIPETEATDISSVLEETFATAVDTTVNPYAEIAGAAFGMSEGTDDAADDLLTMSSGGRGLAGAIGVGAGSGAGGGIRKGTPLGGTRIGRRNSQKGKLEATEKSVLAGLDWLSRHQHPDGSWDPGAYVVNCEGNGGESCSGRGSSAHLAGVTGLALLAFLGAGHDSVHPGSYREVVRDGLKWLRSNQDAEGCFGSRHDPRFTYSHAIATIALCEGYASSRQSVWKKAAQAGLDFVAACRNPYQAWRYGRRPGDNDSSVTGWMIMALKSGKDAGLVVSDAALRESAHWIDGMTDAETGRTGYTRRGEPPVRPEGSGDRWPGGASESLTAVGMCSRIFAGTAEQALPLMRAGRELLEKRLPVWDDDGGRIDMYYWYYGTLAMFQMGGSAWDRWNRNLKSVVVDHQERNGCARGSWEPLDPWCDDGGRVYSTALMTLCLEVYYRFPRVFGTGKGSTGAPDSASRSVTHDR